MVVGCTCCPPPQMPHSSTVPVQHSPWASSCAAQQVPDTSSQALLPPHSPHASGRSSQHSPDASSHRPAAPCAALLELQPWHHPGRRPERTLQPAHPSHPPSSRKSSQGRVRGFEINKARITLSGSHERFCSELQKQGPSSENLIQSTSWLINWAGDELPLQSGFLFSA
jgi:hypothetical protein